jgi:Cu(I)/Ag(I) efflux system membrane fusion protein
MKLNPVILMLILAVVGGAAYFAGKRSTHDARAEQTTKTLYTCGMDPQVIQDHPGNCPICGMKLTPIRKQAGAQVNAGGERKIRYWRAPMDPTYISDKPGKSPMGMDLVPVYEDEAAMDNAISIDPVTIQNMGLRTMVLSNGPLRRVVRTVATIDYDETALADVTTKFKGWVEKLHVDSVGAQVHRGDPLFEVYSPELYSAQTEYLLALQAAPGPSGDSLRQTARTKLRFYDISDAQIEELEKTRKAQKTLQVQAPIDGFVTEKMVVEGQMVDSGMKLYRLANLGIVWVQAQIYEQDLPFIRLGQEAAVTLSYLPDRKFRGRVTYIYPTLDPMTRTARVRMEFHNPGYFLKPGMFASVELVSEIAPSALLVPDMAVLRSGQRNTVFVALDGGKFEPRTVILGVRAEDDMLQVLSGLKVGERIVTSGQFLLDSESQLREAIQKMTEPGKAKAAMGMPAESHAPAEVAPAPPEAAVVYVCPMPEHVAIEYDHPGKCPICGMVLVPVSKGMLEKINPGGKVLYYSCPMPEHSSVHESKPGKCPICGMTLIPVMAKPELPETLPQTSTQDETPLPVLYTCPMASDANVVSDKPGVCPECGMKLVPTSTVNHGKTAEGIWRKEHQH